jgi:hypothetical protein
MGHESKVLQVARQLGWYPVQHKLEIAALEGQASMLQVIHSFPI